MSHIRFGSDGWRGRIAENYTFENVRRVTQAVAGYLCEEVGTAARGVVIGYDRRFGSEHFAAAAAEVLAGNGVHAFLARDATPTPAITFAVLDRQAAGAIIITASHNPPTDNGFKVRDHRGVPLVLKDLKRIEARIPDSPVDVKRVPLREAEDKRLVETFDPVPAYIEYIEKCVDVESIKHAGLVIACDAMWGVGAGWLDRLLAGGSTTLHSIHQERNPLFPGMQRPEPIPPNIDDLVRTVIETGSHLGIATDGDADRIGLVDEHGSFVTQLQVGCLLALYLLDVRDQRGPIVKTLNSTVMLNVLGQRFGVNVFETGTDPKYVGPKVVEVNAMLGATESGGFIFPGLPERDSILAALYILDMMVHTSKKPSQLLDWLYDAIGTRYYYSRVDTLFPPDRRAAIRQQITSAKPSALSGLKVTGLDTTDGFKFNLNDGGWLLIRFSGTEPIIRVYCETADESKVKPLLDEGLKLAGLA